MVIRKNLERAINHSLTVVLVSVISILLAFLGEGTISFFMLIFFTLIVLWANQWNWGYFGLKREHSILWLLPRALLWTVLLVAFAFLVRPLLENLFGAQDLSYFDALRGNIRNYLLTLVQVWLLVAFFEEFVYRGYIMLQFERLFQESRFSKVLALLLSAIVFSFAHSYQGTTGIVFSGTIGLILGIIFYTHKRNLWLTVLVHGLVDSTYLSLIYTGYDIEIAKWIAVYLG